MKNRFRSLVGGWWNETEWILIYLVAGFIMAIPYSFLAGWDKNYLFFIALSLPIISIFLYVLRRMPERFLNDFPVFRKGFWSIICYCLLPIFSNGVSILLGWMGFVAGADIVFKYRYASLVLVPLVTFIGLIVVGNICKLRRSITVWRARKFLRKMSYLRSAVSESVDESGKHCGSKILEEYLLTPHLLKGWVIEEIEKHLEACVACRWKVTGQRRSYFG